MAVLSDGHYGLVTLPIRAKKIRCVWPHKNSRVCVHVQTFENHEGNSQEIEEMFQSKMNKDLKALNKEACEQFNSLLRSVQQSVTYMDFDTYITAVKGFNSLHNMHGL